MMEDANLFLFGSLMELCFVVIILRAVGSPFETSNSAKSQHQQLTQNYFRLQQAMREQRERLTQEYLTLQQDLQQQKVQLTQECTDLKNQLHQQTAEITQQSAKLTQEQHNLETVQQQAELLRQECHQLQQQLQQQEAQLTHNFRQSTFKQLQTLLINYPSASKIAYHKADLPAKNLTPILTPLDNLIHSWGYEVIGPVWSRVAYNPQLHQSDAIDIQPGEMVYIRYVGYKDGNDILCPAKVSRTLPGSKKEANQHVSQSSAS